MPDQGTETTNHHPWNVRQAARFLGVRSADRLSLGRAQADSASARDGPQYPVSQYPTSNVFGRLSGRNPNGCETFWNEPVWRLRAGKQIPLESKSSSVFRLPDPGRVRESPTHNRQSANLPLES